LFPTRLRILMAFTPLRFIRCFGRKLLFKCKFSEYEVGWVYNIYARLGVQDVLMISKKWGRTFASLSKNLGERVPHLPSWIRPLVPATSALAIMRLLYPARRCHAVTVVSAAALQVPRPNIQYSQSHRRFVYLCRIASRRNNIKSQCCRVATRPTVRPLRLISNIACTTCGRKLSVHPIIVRVYLELRTRKQHFR